MLEITSSLIVNITKASVAAATNDPKLNNFGFYLWLLDGEEIDARGH